MTSSYKASWCRSGYYISHTILLWPIKEFKDLGKVSNLPGEKKTALSTLMFRLSKLTKVLDYSQYSSPKKIQWVWARVLSILSNKSFRRGNISKISLGCFQDASQFIVRDIQLCFLSCPSLVVASISVCAPSVLMIYRL